MSLKIIWSAFLAIGLFSQAAVGAPECVMSGISGLWPDENGEWIGASKMNWKDCSDGKSYMAACTHRGSGQNMETCACYINEDLAYESSCEGLVSSPDLLEASRQCCGYFEENNQKH